MNDVKVSVIVPVYNVENYINKCIQSLIDQDYENYEIIIIDDGSTDSSSKIVDQYENFENVFVYHIKNGGVSNARNLGMSKASGEYYMFVDGDDYVEPNYISYFLSLISGDICTAFGNSHFKTVNDKQNTINESKTIVSAKAIEYIYLGSINVAVWNKIYSAKIIKDNNIRFNPKIWYGEGMLFNIEYLQFSNKIKIGHKKVYHQVSNENSAMRKFDLKSNYCGLESLNIQKGKWLIHNDEIENAWEYHYSMFNMSILKGLIKTGQKSQYIELYKKCIKNLKNSKKNILKTNLPSKKKAISISYCIFPVLMANVLNMKDNLKIQAQKRAQ